MGVHVLNPGIIGLDITSVPAILVGMASLVLGFVVFIRERASAVGTRYLFFAAAVAIYIFGAGVSYAITPPVLARLWHRVAHTGAVAIPLAMLVSSLTILGKAGRHRAIVAVVGTTTVVLEVFVWFTDLLLEGVREVFWAWYPVYGPVGYFYVAFFTAVGFWVVFLHARELAHTTVSLHRRRIGMSVLALSIGLLGGIDFWPAMGLEIYAFGFIPISIYLAIMAWVIVRYRLVDITPEVAAASILNTMQGAIIVTDLAGVIRLANRQATAWLASSQRRLQDRDLEHVLAGRSRKIASAAPAVARETAASEGDGVGPLASGQYEWIADSGKTRMVDVAATSLRIGAETIGTVYAAHDITPHKDTERVLADRLRAATRGSDTVARIGGDEFVVLAGAIKDEADCRYIVEKICARIAEPIYLAGHTVEVGASVGVSMYPRDGADAESLVRSADARMYQVKARNSRRA